jgi:Na+/melibiose symporter-like transporter
MSDETGKRPAAAARLSIGTKLGFGVCDLGGNLFFTALGFFAAIYLTDTVGIAPAVAMLILPLGRSSTPSGTPS